MEEGDGLPLDELMDMKPDLSCHEFGKADSELNPCDNSQAENGINDSNMQKTRGDTPKKSSMKRKSKGKSRKAKTKPQQEPTEENQEIAEITERSKNDPKRENSWLLKNAKLDEHGICRMALGRCVAELLL